MRLAGEYGQLRSEMNADAWMYGTTTTKEFTNYRRPDLDSTAQVPEGDFTADTSASMYYVSLDTKGEIGWESGTFNGKNCSVILIVRVFPKRLGRAIRVTLSPDSHHSSINLVLSI